MNETDVISERWRPVLEISRAGTDRVQTELLEESHVLIGRADEVQVRLNHTTVSRFHAELICGPFGRWWIHDLGSTNGTFVNGVRIQERVLNPGDGITIGDFSLSLAQEGPAVAPNSQAANETTSEGAVAAPFSPDDDATMVRLSPSLLPTPHISANLLSKVMGLGRRLLRLEDRRLRQRMLCEFTVGDEFPATAAVVLKLQPGKPAEAVVGPLRRNQRSRALKKYSSTVLKAVVDSKDAVLASNTPGSPTPSLKLTLAGNEQDRAVLACSIGRWEDAEEVLYVELSPLYGTSEWLALIRFMAETFQQGELVWVMRGHVRASAALEHELEMARQIQEALVPQLLALDGLDVAIGFEPCRWVGGDYVDVVPMSDGRVLLAIADVCGKGLQAALVASSLHTLVRATAPRTNSLAEMFVSFNQYLCRYLPEYSFVTMLGIALDPLTGELETVSCGHPPALVMDRQGNVRELQSSENVALGMIETEFTAEMSQLGLDEVMLLYTDGLIEMVDELKRPYGVDRLKDLARDLVRARGIGGVDTLRRQLALQLNAYRGSQMSIDDRTFLVARRTDERTRATIAPPPA